MSNGCKFKVKLNNNLTYEYKNNIHYLNNNGNVKVLNNMSSECVVNAKVKNELIVFTLANGVKIKHNI